MSLVYPSASASDSDNLVFTRSLAERKRWSRKQSRKKWKRSDSSGSDSVALMTPLTIPIFDFHHKRSYDSAYDSDSDSVASENQPSGHEYSF